MKTLTKPVYYCEFCKKHRISRPAMEKHERICTLNPHRVCRWKIDSHPDSVNLPYLSDALQERKPLDSSDIDWLRSETGGCPACMLAALRQSGIDYFHYDPRGQRIFDYDDEVERVRAEEREPVYGY